MVRTWLKAVLALTISTGSCLAQTYPAKSIRIIVPFAAGGGSDVVARLAAERLTKSLGQQVIVENRPGAGGNIGARLVAGAAPDGYTLLHTSSALMVNPGLYKDPGYKLSQFSPLFEAVTNCSIVVTNPQTGLNTLEDAVERARKETLNYGTAGVGSTPYIFAEMLFKGIAKVNAKHVPYSGGAPALTAALGNQVPIVVVTFATGNVVELVQTGKLKGLAITCDKRHPALPDVPTVLESKYSAYGADSTWGAFFVPAGTPAPVADRLNKELNDIFANEPVKSRIAAMGLTFTPNSAEDFAGRVKREAAEWIDRIEKIGVEPQ